MLKQGLLLLSMAAAALAAAPLRAAGGAIASAESSAPMAAQTLEGTKLVSALRAGGYVIYFRHTATDFTKNDSQMTGVDDCPNQRPLNEQGRLDAMHIGRRIRELRLAGGEVLASPMCRTMEHARLTFARATPTAAMRERDAGDFPGLKLLLATPVDKGSNRWLFGHGTPFRTVAGPPQLAEGEAVVLLPQGQTWRVEARLRVEDWAALPAAPPHAPGGRRQ